MLGAEKVSLTLLTLIRDLKKVLELIYPILTILSLRPHFSILVILVNLLLLTNRTLYVHVLTGVYTWPNGDVYRGEWRGLSDGLGERMFHYGPEINGGSSSSSSSSNSSSSSSSSSRSEPKVTNHTTLDLSINHSSKNMLYTSF